MLLLKAETDYTQQDCLERFPKPRAVALGGGRGALRHSNSKANGLLLNVQAFFLLFKYLNVSPLQSALPLPPYYFQGELKEVKYPH